jgi:hypothetical protein
MNHALADCNGDFGGTAFLDNCGDCVGGNTGDEPCVADCNGDFGGTAFLDNCGDCVGGNTGDEPCVADCNGDFGGTAFLDNCGDCVGGNTGDEPCVADCNGDFGGTAFLDNCGDCVGGNTGDEPCVADCNGDFGGTAFLDNCGDCVGGNTGDEPCVADCNGDFGGTAFLDNCGDCVGGNTGDEPCVADCNFGGAFLDCLADFGGTAFLDNCGDCVGGNTQEEPCVADCNGDFGGTAFLDNCGDCVGGNTGDEPCVADCNGDFGGTAFLDNCGDCVGGNTGDEPCVDGIPGDFCSIAIDLTPIVPAVDYGLGLFATNTDVNTLWVSTISGETLCVGSGENDLHYSFEVPFENHYFIRVNPFGGADIVFELYDGCDSSPIMCVNDAGSGEVEEVFIQNLAAGTYIVRVHAFSNTEISNSSEGQFLINVEAFPTTLIMDGTGCNESSLQLEDVVRCNLVFNSIDYEWRFVEVGGGLDATFKRSSIANVGSTNNRNLRLSWVPGIDYNKLYNVYVRAHVTVPGYGDIWGVYRIFGDLEVLGSSDCFVETGTSVTPTQLRPEYSPNNPASGLPHTFCNGLVATWVGLAEQFQWELDGPTFHEVTSPSYFVNLGSIAGLQAGQVYQVRVRARVNGLWGSYGVQLPVSIGLPSNTQVLGYLCGTTRALNQAIAAVNTCGASSYTFRFQHATEAERIIVRPAYTCPLWLVTPALTPGETYSVTVKVNQGGVEGDYSTACDITIAGPQAEGLADEMMVSKVASEGGMGIYPNPNTGSEVRVELDGIEDGAHNVAVTIYDIYGKLMTRDVFGHQGSQLSRLVRFENELATGIYLVHVTINGEIFAIEKLIVK